MIDLHIHTAISDSTWSPEEVVRRARQVGLEAIAITDHERVDGIDMAKNVADDMEIIPGLEFFALYGDYEAHILAYYIDYKSKELMQYLDSLENSRIAQNQIILYKIKQHIGIDIPYKMLYNYSEHGFTSRAQIARALVDIGYIKETQEAFTENLLANRGKCFAPISNTPPDKIIQKIIDFGGIPVLAHPGYSGDYDLDDSQIAEFKDMGIMGLECRHAKHDRVMTEHFEKLADRLDLLKTGGSDCHGDVYNPVKIGTVSIPKEWLHSLKKAAGV